MARPERLNGMGSRGWQERLASMHWTGIGLALMLGGLWMWFVCSSGLHFSSDSAKYLMFALRMRWAGDYAVPPVWPPFYPFAIAQAMRLSSFPGDAAALVSGLAMMLTLMLSVLIPDRLRVPRWLSLMGMASLFCWPGLLDLYRSAWSEGVFVVFVLAAVYFILAHGQRQHPVYFVAAASCVACAALTRYMGYALIACFLVYAGVFAVRKGRWKTSGSILALVCTAVAAGPSLAYGVWNVSRCGAFHGVRKAADVTFLESLQFSLWAIRDNVSPWLWALLVAATIIAIACRRRCRSWAFAEQWYSLLGMVGGMAAYVLILCYATSRASVDPVGARMLAPTFPIMLLCVIVLAGMAITALRSLERQRGLSIGASVVVMCLSVGLCVCHARQLPGMIISTVDRSDRGVWHNEAGVNWSSTARMFSAFLWEQLEDGESIALSVIGTKATRPHLGQSLLFRGSFLGGSGREKVRYECLPENDFAVVFTESQKERRVTLISLPRISNDKELRVALEERFRERGLDQLWLVVCLDERNEIGQDTEGWLPPAIAIGEVVDVDPYRGYELRRR